MSDLYNIDTSKTIEGLRAARSYNDIVVVFGSIKTSIETIQNRLHKKQDVPQMLKDIRLLEEYSFAIQFSRSLNVVNDKKMQRYRSLSNALENQLNATIQQVYVELDKVGTSEESDELKQLSKLVELYLNKTLSVKNYTSIVLPSSPLTHYFIFNNVMSESGYILNQFIVALTSVEQNGKDTFFISFPTRIFQDADKFIITKKSIVSVISKCLNSDNVKILGVGNKQKRIIGQIANVRSSYIEDGVLNIELEAGIGAREINGVLTQLLPQLYIAFNITDPRKDIIHRVSSNGLGNRVVKVMLQNRNFYESKALRTLKKSLNLNAETYKLLQNIMGE